ncbi:urease accessory protein UreF [Thiofilum flexile]|uniref:urease accessory protein UreF n=1 Tax=Thiofilum flexile TaxID=125627 RepID=UPI0003A6167A|nr:urease accessory protein UreF [Thiofilum flexile]
MLIIAIPILALTMGINASTDVALIRLMHLVSPSLPIGSFTYSQGIEWAVEQGWIKTVADLKAWLLSQLNSSLIYVDIPIVKRLYSAAQAQDLTALIYWVEVLLANRETRELMLEEINRGRALADLLIALDIPNAKEWKPILAQSQAAGFVLASVHWQIPLEQALYGYVWSWLENLVLSAVKIIPLGQTQGQACLHQLIPTVLPAIEQGLLLGDEDLGGSSFALALASSRHETQYTRLFRS